MRAFTDGDQLVVVRDDFVDLQESPAMFLPLESKIAETILKEGITALPVGYLARIFTLAQAAAGIADIDSSEAFDRIAHSAECQAQFERRLRECLLVEETE